MDNKIFNVKGTSKEALLKALELCFMIDDRTQNNRRISSWSFDVDKGLLLHWATDSEIHYNAFPVKLSPSECHEMVYSWISSPEASTMNLALDDRQCDDSDIDEELGWRVYTPSLHWSVLCAITPSWVWYGK